MIKALKKAQISIFVEDAQVINKAAWKVVGWIVEVSHQAQSALIADEPMYYNEPFV